MNNRLVVSFSYALSNTFQQVGHSSLINYCKLLKYCAIYDKYDWDIGYFCSHCTHPSLHPVQSWLYCPVRSTSSLQVFQPFLNKMWNEEPQRTKIPTHGATSPFFCKPRRVVLYLLHNIKVPQLTRLSVHWGVLTCVLSVGSTGNAEIIVQLKLGLALILREATRDTEGRGRMCRVGL